MFYLKSPRIRSPNHPKGETEDFWDDGAEEVQESVDLPAEPEPSVDSEELILCPAEEVPEASDIVIEKGGFNSTKTYIWILEDDCSFHFGS